MTWILESDSWSKTLQMEKNSIRLRLPFKSQATKWTTSTRWNQYQIAWEMRETGVRFLESIRGMCHRLKEYTVQSQNTSFVTLTESPEYAVLCILLQTARRSANIPSTFPDVLDPTASPSSLLSNVPSITWDTIHTYSSHRYGTGQMDCSNPRGSTIQTIAIIVICWQYFPINCLETENNRYAYGKMTTNYENCDTIFWRDNIMFIFWSNRQSQTKQVIEHTGS